MEEFKNYYQEDYVGFADIYRKKCDKESKPNNEIDKELYAELVKLDTRLGLQTITIWDHQVFTPAIVDFTFVQFLFIRPFFERVKLEFFTNQ